MSGQRDPEGRRRGGVWLPDHCWDWLGATAARDGMGRSDLVEGLVLLAMDRDHDRATGEAADAIARLDEIEAGP